MRRKSIKSKSTGKSEPKSWGVELKNLPCIKCGSLVMNVAHDAEAVTCWICCFKMLPHDELNPEYKQLHKTYPRGWKSKDIFVDLDGNVYKKGVRQPSMKGTIPVIPYSPRKAIVRKKKDKSQKKKSFKKQVEEFAQTNEEFIKHNSQ